MYARELTSRSGAKCVPAGVPEQQPDPGGGAGARGVVVLHRHLQADPDRRRHVQDDAEAHLLRRCQLQARMATDQRGQNKTREEGEGEARRWRRVRRHASTTNALHQRRPHTSEQRCSFSRRLPWLDAPALYAGASRKRDRGILRRVNSSM
jgi:hypothetical protein